MSTDDNEKDKRKFPPNLYKIGDSWVIDFRFKKRRYRETLGPMSRTIAKEKAANRKTKAAEGELVINGKRWINRQWVTDTPEPEIQDPPFTEALDHWLEWSRANRDEKTWYTDTHNAKPLRVFFKPYHLSQISTFLVDKFRIERRHTCECAITGKPKMKICPLCQKRFKPLSDATLNHEMIILKSLFKKAGEWGMTRHDPTKAVKLTKLSNARTRYLTQAEAERFISACNDDFRDVVLTAIYTGFRSCEIKSLHWPSVDMTRHTVTVLASNAKNKDLKCVPMNDDLFEVFRRIQAERNHPPDGLVFLSRYGKPWKSWRTAFENARERAGITDFKFHDLRHCFASYLAMAGTGKKAMMELLGHRDGKMTDRYTHLSEDYRRQAVQNLPRFRDLAEKSPQKSPHPERTVLVQVAK